jgi:hypothetical protein
LGRGEAEAGLAIQQQIQVGGIPFHRPMWKAWDHPIAQKRRGALDGVVCAHLGAGPDQRKTIIKKAKYSSAGAETNDIRIRQDYDAKDDSQSP